MTKSVGIPKSEGRTCHCTAERPSTPFDIRALDFFRHLSVVICHLADGVMSPTPPSRSALVLAGGRIGSILRGIMKRKQYGARSLVTAALVITCLQSAI